MVHVLLLQDFVFPEDVAYPIGGAGNSRYLLLELHYDNPNLISGDVILPLASSLPPLLL